MPEQNVVIPKSVLERVETLDELYDWLTANSPRIIAELREARREDLASKFNLGIRAICNARLPSRNKQTRQRAARRA